MVLMMKLEEFKKRYISFWKNYNPEKSISREILQSVDRYFKLLSDEKIQFSTVDRILTEFEKENKELPYTFNVVAYILDWMAMERLEAAQNQTDLDKMPIVLPIQGKPIRIVDKPSLAEAVEKIKKNSPELYKILERINAHKVSRPYEYCYACDNTGMIIFSVFVDQITGKKTKKYNQSGDKQDYFVSRRCTCTKGSNLSQQIAQAKVIECVEIARLNQYA